jgi:hypothetical protein
MYSSSDDLVIRVTYLSQAQAIANQSITESVRAEVRMKQRVARDGNATA